jgi:16S rRNA (cytosine1402-N4)-methyltransferase
LDDFTHVPVLVAEVIDWLSPALVQSRPFVDCTLGLGGHAEALLEASPSATVVGIDRDGEALDRARLRLAPFGDRVRLARGNFSDLPAILDELGFDEVSAVLYDLGVSSLQLDRADRGFGYRPGFSLDMRMDLDADLTAAGIVNNYSENRLVEVLSDYGQERFARRIAQAIVKRRVTARFEDAGDLAEVVKSSIPAATRRTGPHPARRTFQALRIETNRELDALKESLPSAIDRLGVGGRVAAISYHSLEDRIVKRVLAERAQGCVCPKGLPVCLCGREPELKILTNKPVRPSAREVALNRRSDSARMRVAERLRSA